jgi:ferredoxin
MKHIKLFGAMAVLCLLMGSAFAVANLMPDVDEKNCNGCGKCVDKCPENAIALSDKGVAEISKDKCTRCHKCVKTCPNEAISVE